MRAYIIILAGLLALTSCCKSNEDKPNILKDVTLNINIKDGLRSSGKNQTLLTPAEIVEKCVGMEFFATEDNVLSTRGFADAQRDYVNNRLKMWASDIIRERDGIIELQTYFLTARDVTLLQGINEDRSDTIAYIPNAVLEKAYKEIKEAFEKKEYQKVYDLFETAYTAIPTTGEIYKQLKKEGKN